MDAEIRPAQLRALAEIVRRGSFSRAAEALHLSQPAVSLQIRQLEEACGLPLLERAGKRALPTEAGRRLLAQSEPALAALDAAMQDLRASRGAVAGRVRLGSGPTVATYLLPPILGRLRNCHPGLEISLVTNHPGDLAAAVTDSELDAALVALPIVGRPLTITPLLSDTLVAIGPPGEKRRRIGPAELARHPLLLFEPRNNIRQTIETWFRRAGLTPAAAMELGNVEAIKKFVAAGFGFSIIPAMAVSGETERGELSQLALSPPLHRRLALIRRRDKVIGPALEAALSALKA